MTCAELRLDEYLDGELAEAERAVVEAHLASCAACRTERERSTKLEAVLRSVPAGAAPDADRRVCHTRCGVAGMSMCRTPRCPSASMIAFCTAGVAPIVPASPIPLAPSGL